MASANAAGYSRLMVKTVLLNALHAKLISVVSVIAKIILPLQILTQMLVFVVKSSHWMANRVVRAVETMKLFLMENVSVMIALI